MLKYSDIPTASEIHDEPFRPEEDEFDRIILSLEAQGHKVILLTRSAAIVEQCEEGDDFPAGWSPHPLKITVYAGIDGQSSSLYIHSGRHGLMEIIEEIGGRQTKAVHIDLDRARAVSSLATGESAQAVYELMTIYLQTGFRRDPQGFSRMEEDSLLAEYAESAKENMRKYLERLAILTRA